MLMKEGDYALLKPEKLKITLENNVLSARIIGDIDHHSAKGLREKIDDEILKNKPFIVLLDMSKVDFMDSSGLGLILGRYTTATDIGAEFILYKPSHTVKRMLELAGIERLMRIEGDTRE